MTDYRILFGRPGALTEIYQPRGGLRATRVRPRSVLATAGGGVRVGTVVGGKRTYVLDYQQLMESTYATLAAYEQGHKGPGPFVLLDPGQRNQLSVNQSSATSESNDTNNFTVSGSGYTISSTTEAVNNSPRSLKVYSQFKVDGSITLDNLAPQDDWFGIPVDIRPYVFSAYALGAGNDPTQDVNLFIQWKSITGSTLSTLASGGITTNSSTWTQVTLTGTPPANTCYAICGVSVTGSTSSAFGNIVYLDSFQFEEGSTPTSWRPGTGVYPVMFAANTNDQSPWAAPQYRASPVFTLQEGGD